MNDKGVKGMKRKTVIEIESLVGKTVEELGGIDGLEMEVERWLKIPFPIYNKRYSLMIDLAERSRTIISSMIEDLRIDSGWLTKQEVSMSLKILESMIEAIQRCEEIDFI